MPPKVKFTREEVIAAALEITREQGFSAVTARGLGARLGSSAKPIFGLFQNMEEVQRETVKAADALYQSYLREDMASGKYPPYKASGMAYIRFAKEQRELFQLLFMRNRSKETAEHTAEEFEPLISLIQKNTGISRDSAVLLHLEMWFYVHGIAAMIATSYSDWDEALISRALTDGYLGLLERHKKENEHGSH